MPTPVVTRSMLELALAYALKGWCVFPLAPGAKTPAIRGGRGCLDATTDPEQIARWWHDMPQAGIGIATGPRSNLLVVDIDPRNGGDETLGALEREYGALPHTVRALTGGGGTHYLYTWPPGLEHRPKGRLGDGIDIKGDGGYIVAPPSIHPVTRKRYRWDLGALPTETALADVPAWIVIAVRGDPTSPARPVIPGGRALDSVIGEALRLAGLVGEDLPRGLVAVCCPWADEHSDGRGRGKDSSTAIFPPTSRKQIGGFCCRHSHCVGRSVSQVLDVLPKEIVFEARRKYGQHVQPVPPPEEFWGESDSAIPVADLVTPEGATDGRKTVLLGEVHESVDRLDEALVGILYQRAHQLIRVVEAKSIVGIGSATPILQALTGPALLEVVSRNIRCMRLQDVEDSRGNRDKIQVPTTPTDRLVINPMLHKGEWDKIQPIRAVIECPSLRPDGSVLQQPGYDERSALLYRPNATYPQIQESPTQAEGQQALRDLQEVFCDFPYASPEHSMVPIAALLSIVGRAAIEGPVPAFCFDATVEGSGKSMHGGAVHIIATGRDAQASTLSANEEEREKVFHAAAVAAAPVIFIDNVKGTMGGPKIEACLTSRVISFRMLGTLSMYALPWLAVILITGNNQQITKDMRRRMLVARLEPEVEDPTTRSGFKHPRLLAWCHAERPRLLAAAITVLRSYLCHGSPDTGVGTLGAPFEAWGDLVPGAIRFAGGSDVTLCRPREESVGGDELTAMRTLVERWEAIDPYGSGISCAEIVRKLSRWDGPPDGLEDLREALELLATDRGGKLKPAPLGYVFRRYEGRWFGTRQFRTVRTVHGARKWAAVSR